MVFDVGIYMRFIGRGLGKWYLDPTIEGALLATV